jgi:hypothetical protein
MPTDPQTSGMKTRGSAAFVVHRLMFRAGAVPQTLVFGIVIPYEQEEDCIAPVQSAGDSESSQNINSYLRSALAEYGDLASETPRRIRMTSSPNARSAQMDPWKAKNDRRVRLIKKKFRGGGLDAKQAAELSRLTAEVAEHVKHVAPRSTEALDEFEEYVSQLRARAENKR